MGYGSRPGFLHSVEFTCECMAERMAELGDT